MVVFVDLENDGLDQNHFVENPHALFQPISMPVKPALGYAHSPPAAEHADRALESPESRAMANQPALNQSSFAAALGCYPIVKEIARAVDLNTMHALSRTCRQFHANLAAYRQQLSKMTLRCDNERIETLLDVLDANASQQQLYVDSPGAGVRAAASSAGLRSRKCARDMVAKCRHCSKVVCRNCAAKSATSSMLKRRIRRLCTTCLTVPLPQLQPPALSCSTQSDFQRSFCTCNVSIWVCPPCCQRLVSDDLIYRQAWSWRIGCSNLGKLEGPRCWRGKHCLAAQDVELEMQCESADSLTSSTNGFYGGDVAESSHGDAGERLRQDTIGNCLRVCGSCGEEVPLQRRWDVYGNGGPVEHRVKKRIMVGACVDYHEDECQTEEYLTREETCLDRAWCNWCMRLIPSQLDLDALQ